MEDPYENEDSQVGRVIPTLQGYTGLLLVNTSQATPEMIQEYLQNACVI
jgi:hypothetical protein